MMSDPDIIWLEPECCANPNWGRTWAEENEWPVSPDKGHDAATKYVRADHIEALEARIWVLEEALQFINGTISTNITETDEAHAMVVGNERYTGPAVDKMYNILTGLGCIAHAALKGKNDE